MSSTVYVENSGVLAARIGDSISTSSGDEFRPTLFRLGDCPTVDHLQAAFHPLPQVEVIDTLSSQLKQLVKIRSAQRRLDAEEVIAEAARTLGESTPAEYGVWAWYPWSRRIVHLLPETQFVELRTNRNLYKITPSERNLLSTKRVGVVGLSVGQCVAVTLAMERVFGEIRLADFDTLELSNLNRLRAGVHELGVPKVQLAAREIAQIAPYLQVQCFPGGITEENIEAFLQDPAPLDLVFEECDSLDIKILVRQRARAHRIPVVMETSDRGMLDVERFDLKPHRPILHGLVGDLNTHSLRGLSTEQKLPFVLGILGAQSTSARGRASLLEMDETITGWPQLASAVTQGGAVCTDVGRRLLLGHGIASGRFYVDLGQLVPARDPTLESHDVSPGSAAVHVPLPTHLLTAAANASMWATGTVLPREHIARIVEVGATAPSGGNGQPWRWRFVEQTLFLVPDVSRETPWLGAEGRATQLALGAAAENVVLFSRANGLHADLRTLPAHNGEPQFVAFRFAECRPGGTDVADLAGAIEERCTNRRIVRRAPLPAGGLEAVTSSAEQIAGIRCHVLKSDDELAAIRDILGAGTQAQLLDPHLRGALMDEIRWTQDEVLARRDGIDVPSLELTPVDHAALDLLRDGAPLALLAKWGLGRGLRRMMHRAIDSASAVVLISMPDASHSSYFDAGRALQRAWLASTVRGIAFQPVGPVAFMFARRHALHGTGVSSEMERTLAELWPRYRRLFGIDERRGQGMLFRLFMASSPTSRSLRRAVSDILTFA